MYKKFEQAISPVFDDLDNEPELTIKKGASVRLKVANGVLFIVNVENIDNESIKGVIESIDGLDLRGSHPEYWDGKYFWKPHDNIEIPLANLYQRPHYNIRREWRDLVGDFLLTFGDIEWASYRLWLDKVTPEERENLKGRHRNFTDRTKQVIKAHKEINNLLERAVELAKKRNTIAHNPLSLLVFRNEATGELYRAHALNSFINENELIDLPDLKELLAEATYIKTELYQKHGLFN